MCVPTKCRDVVSAEAERKARREAVDTATHGFTSATTQQSRVTLKSIQASYKYLLKLYSRESIAAML